MATKQEIKDRIKMLEAQLENVETEEGLLDGIKLLSEFTDEEKRAAFDRLYAYTHSGLVYIVENKYERKDDTYYTYELAVTLTIGRVAFDIINGIM